MRSRSEAFPESKQERHKVVAIRAGGERSKTIHSADPKRGRLNVRQPFYKNYDTAPIALRAHCHESEPISFRNIGVGKLP
jgi:hypothetical protein